jgi:hypothetical protein
LLNATDELVNGHANHVYNNFAEWVDSSVGNYLLSEALREAYGKRQLLNTLTDHIEMLEEAV